MSAVILKLVLDESVFSAVSDSLLVFEPEKIEYNSISIRSYSNEHKLEGTKEQVAGYLAKVQIEIRTTEADYASILSYLKNNHPNIALQYWVVPILTSGVL